MKNSPKISVIMAVYNAESYLRKSIDSVLAQSFADFELLLVNDGSKDGSGSICDGYAALDARVKVFHKSNGGVSSARQKGLSEAVGDFVIHIDPDDWVEADMFERMYQVSEDADMIMCDLMRESESTGKTEILLQKPTSLGRETVLAEMLDTLSGSCCNKLVRRSLFEQYGVSFPVGMNFSEDLYVVVSLLMNDIRVKYVPGAFYHYVQDINPASLVRTYSLKAYDNDLIVKKRFAELLASVPDMARKCDDRLNRSIVSRAFYSGIFSNSEFRRNLCGYRHSIISSDAFSFKFRWILYFSTLGLYKPLKSIYNLLAK